MTIADSYRRITLDPNRRYCYTLEPPIKHDGSKPRAIPAGTYEVRALFSPKHARLIPHVMGVPGFTAIEIHIGNYGAEHLGKFGTPLPPDTEGCTLVGRSRGLSPDFIVDSSLAFEPFAQRIAEGEAEGEKMFITYVDAPGTDTTKGVDTDGAIVQNQTAAANNESGKASSTAAGS